MKRGILMWVVASGLGVGSGCADDEPEDGTSTAATTVDVTTATTTDEPASTGSSEGSSTGGAGSTSGSSDDSTGTLLDVVYEDDVQPLWNANCTCHLMGSSGTMTATVLTLNPEISYGELVSVPSEQSDLQRVVANDLEGSYLWRKVSETHAEVGEGTEMPPGNVLDPDDLNVIRSWILTGAQP